MDVFIYLGALLRAGTGAGADDDHVFLPVVVP